MQNAKWGTSVVGSRMNVQEIKACRICGGERLALVASLGEQCVSGAFLACKSVTPEVPLVVVRCQRCGLVQLQHSVPPELMYKKYWYRSGVNQTMREHLKGIVEEAKARVKLEARDMVLDIGCNDGTLLEAYGVTPGPYDTIQMMGMDPAANMIELALAKGLPVVCDFFSAERYYSMMNKNQKPKIITSIAMFYDLEDPNRFVADIKEILHPEGIWVLEMSYLPTMLERNSFDTICHEHLEYYHLEPLEEMLLTNDLELVDVSLNDMNGGSFRVTVMHDDRLSEDAEGQERLQQMRADEMMLGLDSDGPYMNFRRNIEKVKCDVQLFLKSAKEAGKVVHGYGASTKGNTILQFCAVTQDLLPVIADRNESKWGHFTVGTNIPIISEAESRAAKPDYYFVLPWHFMAEFRMRETEFLARGGRFVLPLPMLAIDPGPTWTKCIAS